MIMPKVGVRDYYDLDPPLEHAPGDVWSDLPTFGILRTDRVSGLVITPACDLSNRKVETITYLPIVAVRQFFVNTGFLPEAIRNTSGQLEAAKLASLLPTGRTYCPLPKEDTEQLHSLIALEIATPNVAPKTKSALERAQAGLRLLADIAMGVPRSESTKDLSSLLGRKVFRDLLEKLITNNYRSDLHFLPCDGQPSAWSGTPEHSLALFRYPITAPLELFERAQDSSEGEWAKEVERLVQYFPCATHFSGKRPLKRIRVKPRFMSDLLMRYIGIYSRLGSPDFSADTVEQYANAIGAP